MLEEENQGIKTSLFLRSLTRKINKKNLVEMEHQDKLEDLKKKTCKLYGIQGHNHRSCAQN